VHRLKTNDRKKNTFFVLICLRDEIPSSGGSTRICTTAKWLPNPKGVAEPKNSEILQPIKIDRFTTVILSQYLRRVLPNPFCKVNEKAVAEPCGNPTLPCIR
jgi:hypothetical protein